MLRIPQCLDNRLTDGAAVVSLRAGKLSLEQTWRPVGLWDVEEPTFPRQTAYRGRGGCQPYAMAALYPRKIPGSNLFFRLSRLQGHSVAGRIRWIEISNNLIGNRNHDLPTSCIVPHPTTLPRSWKSFNIYTLYVCVFVCPRAWGRLFQLWMDNWNTSDNCNDDIQ
jgi:hypothetical protein